MKLQKKKMYAVYFSYFIFLIQSLHFFYHFYFTGKLSKSWQGVLGFHLSIEYDLFDLHPDVDLLCIINFPYPLDSSGSSSRTCLFFLDFYFSNIFRVKNIDACSQWNYKIYAIRAFLCV